MPGEQSKWRAAGLTCNVGAVPQQSECADYSHHYSGQETEEGSLRILSSFRKSRKWSNSLVEQLAISISCTLNFEMQIRLKSSAKLSRTKWKQPVVEINHRIGLLLVPTQRATFKFG